VNFARPPRPRRDEAWPVAGNPEDDPISRFIHCGWREANRWRDLNAQLVLMNCPDFAPTGITDLDMLWFAHPPAPAAPVHEKRRLQKSQPRLGTSVLHFFGQPFGLAPREICTSIRSKRRKQ